MLFIYYHIIPNTKYYFSVPVRFHHSYTNLLVFIYCFKVFRFSSCYYHPANKNYDTNNPNCDFDNRFLIHYTDPLSKLLFFHPVFAARESHCQQSYNQINKGKYIEQFFIKSEKKLQRKAGKAPETILEETSFSLSPSLPASLNKQNK